MLTIQNGQVFTGGELIFADVIIKDGRIAQIGQNLTPQGTVIDAGGRVISHGFIDLHVHLREPGYPNKETIATGTAAAAAGGFTTICSMPNLNPVPDSATHLQAQLDLIAAHARVQVLPFASITVGEKGEELVDMAALASKVCGFSDDGKGVQSDELMDKVMAQAAKLDVLISAHCEDETLLKGGYIHDGIYAADHGHKGICSACEYAQVRRDIALAQKHGARYHVCHISAKESIDAVRDAKGLGLPVSCEVTPHHIALSEQHITADDGRFKMNPPLRSEEDREAIINGILDGTIDCIATDHAPHSAEEKGRGLRNSAMGIVGLETAFAVCYTELVKNNGLPLAQLLELLTAGGKLIGVEHDLQEGAVADIVIVDPEAHYTIDSTAFVSMGKCTPFDGMEVWGKVTNTIVKGKEVYCNVQ